jgi:Matrixin
MYKILIFFIYTILIITNIFQINSSFIYSTNQKLDQSAKKQIEICCTWGETLVDGILTYEIKNAKPETKELVISALNFWEQNIKGIEFKEAVGSKEQTDIKISFRNDNGKVAGQTITNFDSEGFIFNIHILLAEKAFGKQLNKNLIEYIAKHEIGHALGLGHANFNESIMSSLVYHSYNEISDCEREAIAEANKWKLIDNQPLPKTSQIKQYYC